MPPDLDAMIAEKLFAPWPEDRCRICGWRLSPTLDEGCVKDSCSLRPPPSRRADEPHAYSTSISDSWLVVEEMRKRGFEVCIDSEGSDCWDVYFDLPGSKGTKSGCMSGGNLPSVICLAACRALGVEVKK